MRKSLLYSLILASVSSAYADADFENLWKSIEHNSLALKASSESVEAANLDVSRTKRHWLPTVYATGQSYLTNDPGANMFGLLSQRKIEQTDFMPEKLNHPGSNLLTKGTIGLNLPLYEGGMKKSLADVSVHQYEAKKSEAKANQSGLFSEVAKSYFTIKSLESYQAEMNKMDSTLGSILGRYQLGNKSNMLGYSGLLGLKSLKNRIKAINEETRAKREAYQKALEELNGDRIQIVSKSAESYLKEADRYLAGDSKYNASAKIKALNEAADAAKAAVGAEKSRNLPRVGLFAESYAFNGERNTGTGFSTGLYINWNLYSGTDHGASDVALHNSHAAKFYAEAMTQKEKIEFNSLKEMEETLAKTMITLEESQRLLDEQTTVANSLFKNGMINALQLTEVLSRRVDLLKNKNEVETNLIETKAKKYEFTAKY